MVDVSNNGGHCTLISSMIGMVINGVTNMYDVGKRGNAYYHFRVQAELTLNMLGKKDVLGLCSHFTRNRFGYGSKFISRIRMSSIKMEDGSDVYMCRGALLCIKHISLHYYKRIVFYASETMSVKDEEFLRYQCQVCGTYCDSGADYYNRRTIHDACARGVIDSYKAVEPMVKAALIAGVLDGNLASCVDVVFLILLRREICKQPTQIALFDDLTGIVESKVLSLDKVDLMIE